MTRAIACLVKHQPGNLFPVKAKEVEFKSQELRGFLDSLDYLLVHCIVGHRISIRFCVLTVQM